MPNENENGNGALTPPANDPKPETNNTNPPSNDGNGTPPQTNQFDYQSAYEKLQKDFANQKKYTDDLKTKLQAKMTEEERLRSEQEERNNYYLGLEKENKTMKFRSELSKSITDNSVVESITQSFVDDDINGGLQKINEYIVKQRETYEQKLKEQSLTNNQTPPPQNGNGQKTWKDYSMEELNKLMETNRAEYNRILNSIK